jgi:outer membrane immunogenic protein
MTAGVRDTTTATTAALAAIAAASSGATAADMSFAKVPAPVLAPTWQGLYVGGSLGASWLNSVQDPAGISIGSAGPFAGIPGFVTTTGSPSSTANAVGFLGGFQVGHNWQHGNFVYGLEADFSWIGSNNATSANSLSFRYGAASSGSSKVDGLATFRARFGLDFNGTLPYLTAGFALGHMNNIFSLTAYNGAAFLTNSTSTITQTSWVPGVVLGGGLEHQLTRNWTLRGEIMWVGFQSKDLANPLPFAAPAYGAVNNGGVAKFSDSLTIGKVGMNYRF